MISTAQEVDPTQALRKFIGSGTRREALCALLAQPYLKDVPEEVVARLATDIPVDSKDSGKTLLKALPLKRAARRALFSADRWAVHLCSGPGATDNPLAHWCDEQSIPLLQVDLRAKGGKGWDLTKADGVWKVLLWAAATGKIAVIMSSPPTLREGSVEGIHLQGMILWSVSSVARGRGIPLVAEEAGVQEEVNERFASWSGANRLVLNQGSLGAEYLRPMKVLTNLDLSYVASLPPRGRPEAPPGGRIWTREFRREVVKALSGRPSTPSCEDLDKVISEALLGSADSMRAAPTDAKALTNVPTPDPCAATVVPEGGAEGVEVQRVAELSDADLERWREHLLNGHVPYRRDCKQCIEGAAVGIQRRKIRYPQSYTLSADLFGPVPADERGRDESCVSGNCHLKYALVGAFRIPKSAIEGVAEHCGLEDLGGSETLPRAGDDEGLEEYEPSEPGVPFTDLSPDQERELQELLEPPSAEACARGEVPFSAEAVAAEEPVSLLAEEDLPQDPKAFKELVQELRDPVEQVVLRYVVPLKGKSGPDVAEGLQKMILGINVRYPVRVLHTDLGTEFMSTNLSKWLAAQGVRHQHTLPTDKKGNGLAERTVGWVKARIRTLICSSGLPICWWPIAARWAAHSHNRKILGQPRLPAFGQRVLHRVKQPADGLRQLMNRWVETRYGAPHLSIPDGHVLITDQGNLVASRGFKEGSVDPNALEDLEMPVLQEHEAQEEQELPVSDAVPDQEASAPERRLRAKTAVRFMECDEHQDPESVARDCLLKGDYGLEALRALLPLLPREASSLKDRRAAFEDKFVFGAYCHGGQRGITAITRRLPMTVQFLNQCLRARTHHLSGVDSPTWTAVMVAKAGDIGVHRDYRNEWGSVNHAFCVPGALELWIDPSSTQTRKGLTPQPSWNSSEVRDLSKELVTFNAREPHAVRRLADWVIVGYTPLGSVKLEDSLWDRLQSFGFPTPDKPDTPHQVRVVSAPGDSPNSEADEHLNEEVSEAHPVQGPLEQDLQEDSVTQLVGWDFSSGDPGDAVHGNLLRVDLYAYLRERFAENEYQRLSANGVESPADLPFLYEEDLIEMGIAPQVAGRIMHGVHPPGTRRPDCPALSSLTTGEVRLFDRAQRQIPWVIQNRTLLQGNPGPPIGGLGVFEPGHEWMPFYGGQDPLGIPVEPGGHNPPGMPDPQDPEERGCSSHEPVRRPHQADALVEDQLQMMYLESMWQDEDDDPATASWVQAAWAYEHPDHRVPRDQEEDRPDPSASSSSRPPDNPRCMAVKAELDEQCNQSGGCVSSQSHGQIGVPVANPVLSLERAPQGVHQGPTVCKVDDAMYTPNIEELLEGLKGPLEVVHNVSPSEVRQNLEKWRAAANAEIDSLESMKAIRRLKGTQAREAMKNSAIEVIPAKAVCTVKPGSPFKRKMRVVSCGNYASTTEEASLYAGGAGAECLRALLIHSGCRGRRCFGSDIKSAFLQAPIPSHVKKRYAVRPPRLLIDLGICTPEEIWIIEKALYGFRESPKWRGTHRDSVLTTAEWTDGQDRFRLKQLASETNVWAILASSGECAGHLLIYVDDLLLVTHESIAKSFIGWIQERWECTSLQAATPTVPLRFLGVVWTSTRKQTLQEQLDLLYLKSPTSTS